MIPGTPSSETQAQIVDMFDKSGFVGLVLFTDMIVMAVLLYLLFRIVKLYVDFASKREEIETQRSLVVERTAAALATLTQVLDSRIEHLEDSLKGNTEQLSRLRDKISFGYRANNSGREGE